MTTPWDDEGEEYYEPEPAPLVDPIGLPTFHDLNLPDRAYRWMRLEREDYYGPRLDISFCGKIVHGEEPEWLKEEEEFPYYEILHPNCLSWMEWGLRKAGVAPGEPFLVQASQPIYYDEEYGANWYGGIVRRLKCNAVSRSNSWAYLLKDLERSRSLRKADVAAMKLRYWYGAAREVEISLVSKHGGVTLAIAKGNSQEEALRGLLSKAVRVLPGETVEKLVPTLFRSVPLNRWERLGFPDRLVGAEY